VVSNGRIVASYRSRREELWKPVGPIPLPSVAKDAAGVVTSEQHSATALAVVCHGVTDARRRSLDDPLGPVGSVPFPGLAEVVAAPKATKEHTPGAEGVVGHCKVVASSRSAGCPLVPSGPIPLP